MRKNFQKRHLCLFAALATTAAYPLFAGDSVTRTWVGGSAGEFRASSNWDPAGVPANTDKCFFTNDVAVNLNRPTDKADKNGSSYAYVEHTADGCTVTFSTLSDAGELVLWQPRTLAVANGGRWVFNSVELSKRVTSGSVAWDLAAGTYSFAPHSTNVLHTTAGKTAGVFRGELDNDAFIEVRDGGAYSFPGASTNYLGRLTAPIAMTNALGLADNMVVWGRTTNTVTFVNALKCPTCSVMLPTVPHATPVSVDVNGFERLHDDDSYTVYAGSTITATFEPDEGYTLSTNVCVLSHITASCVIPDALLPVATKIEERIADADAYIWTGGAYDNNWETLANWSLNGALPENPPTIADTVVFPSGESWTLRLTNTVAVSNLNARGNLEISGGLVQAKLVHGDGRITLGDDAGFSTYDPAGSSLIISNNLQIAGNVTFRNVQATSKLGSSIKLLGNLTGTGTATFSGNRLDCALSGDNRAFAGTIYVKNDGIARNATYLANANASSSNACWRVENSGGRNFTPNGSTCYFGELTGYFRRAVAAYWTKISTDVIGARNTDFTTDGIFGTASDRSDRIVKVGTGTMTFVGSRAKGFEVQNGTILFTTTNSIPYDDYRFAGGTIRLAPSFDADISGRIRNSTGPIIFDDGGTNRTWATALDASNMRHEIVKRGAGTLTLLAAPNWDSATVTVEDGELVIPSTLYPLPSTLSPSPDTLVTTNGDGTVSFKPDFATVEDGAHEILNLNRGWSFVKCSTYPLASAIAETNELEWTQVALPHSINAHDTFNKRANDSGAPGWRGIAFYRRSLLLPIKQSDNQTIKQSNNQTIQQSNNPTIKQSNNPTIQQSKFLLEFETVRQAIYLWVNGQPVGYYEAGIASSCFDITSVLHDGTNEVTVALDSTSGRGLTTYLAETVPGTAWNSQTGTGFQWNSNDFNPTEGGLTGSVRLHVKPQTYLTLPIYNNLKTSGTLVTASDFDFARSNATITVAAEVRNESGAKRRLAIAFQIADAGSGAVVGAFTNEFASVPAATDAGTNFTTAVESDVYEQDVRGAWQGVSNVTTRLASGVETTVLTASAKIGKLVFWSPDTPHLYDVKVKLLTSQSNNQTIQQSNNFQPVDEVNIRTGFRKVAYGRETGLTINGKSFWLTGYAQRATDEWAAIGIPPDWLYEYDAALMRESGANFIRWMHIAPKPKMQRALDKYGVVSVVPAGDKEAAPGWGRAWSQRQEAMRDTILYFRNSPSAIFWEAGNNEIPASHMGRMVEIRKALDPSGGRFMGCRTLQQADNIAAAEWVGTMLNRHANKAYACMKKTGNYIPILETEYAREESPRRCWDDYTPPDYDYINRWLGSGGAKTSGYDIYDYNQEDFTRANFDTGAGYAHFYGNRATGIKNRYYAGCAALCWADSIQHGRNAWAENARMSGRVDPVRLRKPNFRAYQAAQATVPKIAILGHWSYEKKVGGSYLYPLREWNGTYWEYTGEYGEREPTNKTVYVVGSVHCAKVELYVNDVLKGTCTEPERIFLFPFPGIDVTESGRVSARAYDAEDNLIAEDAIVSAGAADHLEITVTTGPDGWQADGSDIAMVDIRLVDAAGTLLPAATNRLEFILSTQSAQSAQSNNQTIQQSNNPTIQQSNNSPSFLGGYNSGTYDNAEGAPCGASPIGQNWVNLEAGENRVFVRAGDEAGETTLTVTVPSLGWTTNVVLTSVAPDDFPQTFAANQTNYTAETDLPAVNDLGGSADPPAYTVYVNGLPVDYETTPWKPDEQTGVVAPLEKTVGRLIDIGCPIATNVEDGAFVISNRTDGLRLCYAPGETAVRLLYANGKEDSTLTDYAFTEADGELLVEIASFVPYIPNLTVRTDDTDDTVDFVYQTEPATYVWRGGMSGAWADAANWSDTNGNAVASLPSDKDTAIINATATISLARSITLANLVLNADVTFDSSTYFLHLLSLSGTGTLVAKDTTTVKGTSGQGLDITCGLDIPEGATLRFAMPSANAINFFGTLTGGGALATDQSATKNCGGFAFRATADGSAFAGTFAVENPNTSARRDGTSFYTPAAVSSSAAYSLWGYDDGKTATFKEDNATYCLGALNGYVSLVGKTNVTLIVGARGGDSTFAQESNLNGNRLVVASPGTLVIPLGWSYTNIVVEAGARIAVDGSNLTELQLTGTDPILAVPGLSVDAFEIRNAKIYVTTSYDAATGKLYAHRTIGDYFWTDATGDHNPQTLGNWSVATGPDTYEDATALPGLTATAHVTGDAVIRPAGANFNISNLIVTGRCLLAPKAGEQTVYTSILGDGTLVLSNATLRPYAATAPIYPTLDIAAGTTNALAIGDKGFHAFAYGPLAGAGTLDLTSLLSGKNTYAGVRLNGDASAFTGTCRLYPFANHKGTQLRDTHQFVATNSTSAAARYEINVNTVNDTMYAAVFPTAGTYRLGSLVGKNAGKSIANNVTLEIGGRDESSVFSGNWGGKSGAVVWTASTATYSNRITGVSAITATAAGTVVVGTNAMPSTSLAFTGWNGTLKLDVSDPALDPSAILSIAEGASLIYDDEGVSRTWSATSLKNVAGILIKRGAGTLTLNAAPLGALLVEEGVAIVGTRRLGPGEAVIGSSLALAGTLDLTNALAPGSVCLFGKEMKVKGEQWNLTASESNNQTIQQSNNSHSSTNFIHGTISVAGSGYTIGPSLAGGVACIAFSGTAGTVTLNNTAPYAIGAITNVAALYLNGNDATVDWDAIDKTSLGYVYIAGTNTLTSSTNDPLPSTLYPLSSLFDRVQPVVADGARLYLQVGDDTYIYRGEDADGEIECEKREPDPTPVCQLGGQGLTALLATNWSVVVQGSLTPLILSEVWSISTNGETAISLTSGGRDKVALADVIASVEWSAYRHHTYAVTFDAATQTLALWIDGVKIATTTSNLQPSTSNLQPSTSNLQSFSLSLNGDGKCTIDRCDIYDRVLTRDFIERDAAAHPVTPTDEPVQSVHVVTGEQQATDLTGYDANTDLVIVTNAWGYFMKKAVSVECEVRFDGDVAFTMESGFSDTGTIFAYVSGSGDIVNGGKATTHTFYFQDATDFTGSIILTNQANRIAFAARMDEADWPVGGSDGSSGYFADASRSQIYVAPGSLAALKDGGSWVCNTRLTIDGTLACRGAARLHCAGGISVGGEITIPDGYVRTDFYGDEVMAEGEQTIKQSNNQTIQQSNNPTIQQSNNPTIKQSNNSLPTTIVIEPAIYIWTGAAGDTLWSSSNNWLRISANSNNPTIQQSNICQVPIPFSTVLIGPSADLQPSTSNLQPSLTNVIEISSQISLASVTISNDANTAILLRGSGALVSSVALSKQGGGNLILESETLTMPIAIGGGKLLVDGSRLEQGLSLNYVSGGELEITAGTVTLTNNFETVVTIDADATCVLTTGHKVNRNSSGAIRGAGTLEFANAIGYNGSSRSWGSLSDMTGTVRMDAGTSITCATGNNCKQFGTGTLELGGATVNASGGSTSRYLGVGTVNVLEGTSSTINEATARMYVTGNLIGSGSLAFTTAQRALVLSGDNAAFAGTLVHNGGTTYLDDPAIIERTATSARAAWELNATGSYADHGYTYLFKGDSSANQPFAFGTLRLPNVATKLSFPEGAWIEIGARGEAFDLTGTIVSNAVNLVVTGGAESSWMVTDPLPAGSSVTVKSGLLKMAHRASPYACGTDTMTFTDGATDYYLNVASEPPKADFWLDGVLYEDTYLMTAGALIKPGSVVKLRSGTGLVRTFAPGVTDITLDLNGQILSNANDAATWMIAAGTNALTIVNGTIDCGDGYGIFVTDGRLELSNVTVRAAGRCVQVAGAGRVRIDAASRLVTSGNDPTLMAVGGYDGRATVEIAGTVENTCASVPAGEDDWRYAIAGHAQDLAGVDFIFLKGSELAAVAERPPYLRPANGSGSVSDSRETGVTIPDDWKTSHGYAADTSGETLGANGLSLTESYLLGLDPTNEKDVPTATISFDAEGRIVVTLEPVTPNAAYAEAIRFVLEDIELCNGGSVNAATTNASSAFTIDRDPDRTRQFFRIKTLLKY